MTDETKGLFANLKAGMKKIWHFFRKIGSWYKHQYVGQPWWRKILTFLWSLALFILFYVCAVLFNFFWLFGESPSINDIKNPKNAAASEIYSADGNKLLGKFFNENRSPVSYESISPVFFQALISTEDERFYEHHGIDVQGIFAALKDATQGHARGASTISQQLVKNIFRVRTHYSTGILGKVPGLRMLVMKSKEMIIATGLEYCSSKKEILELYANTVDFGSNAYGIKTAAKTYFNTTPDKLKPEEAAVLVGLLKATSYYNPKINPLNSRKRRNTVLQNMYNHREMLREHFDKIYVADEATLSRLQASELKLNFNVENAYDGKALYFREAVKDYIEEKCPELDVFSDGLKIYTTLDSRMQEYAEKAVYEQMKRIQQNFDRHWRGMGDPWRDEKGNVISGFIEDKLTKTDAYKMLLARFPNNPDSIDYYLNKPHPVKLFSYDGEKTEIMSTIDSLRYMVKFMHTGLIAIEPENGYVKAYVGDIDFKTWKYDKVKAMRQPGSTFKLFVYSTAMKLGKTPADTEKDAYIQMDVYDPKTKTTTTWRPHNANGRFTNAEMPLRAAFAQSINTVAVRLGQEVGIPSIIQTAHEMGIKSPLDEIPSLALGSSDVNLLELVNAYGTVANNGIHVEPVLVTKIVNSDGDVVYEAKKEENRALPEKAAFYMQQLLKAGVTDGGGTSQPIASMTYLGKYWNYLDIGGKTGTSNNHSDAWFVGVTPSLVAGAWVGGEYRSIHFRTGALGQGSRTALPIVAQFLRSVMDNSSLQKKYCHKYGLPPKDIDVSTYQVSYSAPATEPDSLSEDSLSLENEEPFDNLMDIEDENSEKPTSPENIEREENAMPSRQENIKQKKGNSDDLFE